jgi:hypothetical protein
VTVEVLFLPGCPKYRAVARSVNEAMVRLGASQEIELRPIATAEDAERERFLGSPTVRVDGRDIDPDASDRDDFGLKCRLYRSATGTTGVPPQEWIMAAMGGHARSRDDQPARDREA